MAAPQPSGGGRFGCYVGNIDASVPIETIRQVFSQCGQILDASLNGRESDPYRFGFIDFTNEADRERALKFNGITLAGRQLKVGVSKGNVGRPGEGMPNNRGGHGGDAGISESTALLVQLVQSGAVNPANLTAEQQRLLSGALLGGMVPPMGMAPPSMMPSPQMGGQMMGGMMPPQGAYGGYAQQGAPSPYGAPRGGPGGYRRGPPSANPPPSEELVMLRQAQRKTFFDKVTKEAERYQEKLQKRKNKRDGSVGSDSDSSSSDDGEERRRRPSKEHRKERSGDRRERRDDRRDDRREEHSGASGEPRRDHSSAQDEQRQQPDDSRNAL
jgi:RNA recognition motif-containing protein